MEATITVILDEEIIELFGPAFWRHSVQITPGVEAFKYDGRRFWYWDVADRKELFRVGSEAWSHYDDEFTEWLKVHRPEVFL